VVQSVILLLGSSYTDKRGNRPDYSDGTERAPRFVFARRETGTRRLRADAARHRTRILEIAVIGALLVACKLPKVYDTEVSEMVTR
jgi:hypothetical protein